MAHIYTIPSLQIRTFPAYIADHLVHYLAQEVVAARGIRTNYDDAIAEAKKEIVVEL